MRPRSWVLPFLLVGCGTVATPMGAATVPAGSPAPEPARVSARSAPGAARTNGHPDLHLRCAFRDQCPEAVGMVVFDHAGPELERCTATLVDTDEVLTASHCLPASMRRRGASCEGGWVLFPSGDARPAEWRSCERVLHASRLDEEGVLHHDQARLTLSASVARTPLSVNGRAPEPGTIVTVASIAPHRIYRAHHVLSVRHCRVESDALPQRVLGPGASQVGWLSDCSIIPGNSGAPVIDRDGHVRAIVHAGNGPHYAVGVTSPVPTDAARDPSSPAQPRPPRR